MKIKLAFMGFRHGHIFALQQHASQRTDVEIVAACEEHTETRNELIKTGKIKITHDNYQKMLDEANCDAIAVGDYYGRRGAIIIEALKRGKHVISDKPICTSLEEIKQITSLSSRNKLSIGCQLDLRDYPKPIALRNLIKSGRMGEILAITFTGQHPLNYGKRPSWYFEKGCHGGTINDIAIHAIDLIPWLTGHNFRKINACRNWNARLKEIPHFKDGAQLMMELDNDAGILGDVSYFSPDAFSYGLPSYWRFTVWGTNGMAEFSLTTPDLLFYENGKNAPESIKLPEPVTGGYLDSFIKEINGADKSSLSLTTQEVLFSSTTTLIAQHAADHNLCNVTIKSL